MRNRHEYLSAIATEAEERVTERYENGSRKHAEYILHGEVTGWREFWESGNVETEKSVRDGHRHRQMLEWHEHGTLAFATAYVDGREHGAAKQWAKDGTLVGTYDMDHGTGLDLWWCERAGGSWHLSEARYLLAGDRHGYEWRLDGDRESVWEESHFQHGQEHGIFRSWNAQGRLRRGYPQYFITGRKVTKRQYLRAAQADAGLPAFREEDNRPAWHFPPEVAAAPRLAAGTAERLSK
jgi:antitoxin component YwqK of YwqJK toxin-antitoxin module